MLPGLNAIAAAATASIIDTARVAGLSDRLNAAGAKCLYQGKSEQELADVAPYLLGVPEDSAASQLVFGELWGQSAAVHVVTAASLAELRTHLRHFLMVVTEEGKNLYFRFYDPRVLRLFLPTCAPEQLTEFFGPIEAFYAEDQDPAKALRFTMEDGALKTEVLDLAVEAQKKPVIKIGWKGQR